MAKVATTGRSSTPAAHPAGIDVDKVRAGVVANTAASHRDCGIAEFRQLYAGQSNVNGFAQQALARMGVIRRTGDSRRPAQGARYRLDVSF